LRDSLLHDIGNIDHAIKIAFNSLDGRVADNAELLDACTGNLLDDDVDSRISKTEFRKLLLHSRGFYTGEEVSNDDGEGGDLQRRELTRELSRTVDSEVDTFFMLLDKDSDGFLDQTEFVKKSE
jgi:Ca2+-binding EF-hand superfamily protein